MALTHEFVLIERKKIDEPSYYLFTEGMDQVEIHDDLILYIMDSLRWIPTSNAAIRSAPLDFGLYVHGVTLIQNEGARLLRDICLGWAALFSHAPEEIVLTGLYTEVEGTEGFYEKITVSKESIIQDLTSLATLADQAASQSEHYCILHKGI